MFSVTTRSAIPLFMIRHTFMFCAHRGLGVLPYWPLEQGLLTGRYSPANPPANANSQTLARLAMVEKLKPLAKTIGRPLSQIALSWLLSRPGVAAVIPGASRVEQLEDNCGVADWNVSADEIYEIDRVLAAPAAG